MVDRTRKVDRIVKEKFEAPDTNGKSVVVVYGATGDNGCLHSDGTRGARQ